MMTAVRLLLILLLAWAQPGAAQSYGSNKNALSERTTNAIVRRLDRGLRQCGALDPVYRYDCYRQNYRDTAREIAANAAYAPARAALHTLETRLETVLDANADPDAPVLRQRGRRYTAIRPEAVPASKAAFTEALEDARTQLLRSPDNRGTHFARIAEVLDSEKVFLRS